MNRSAPVFALLTSTAIALTAMGARSESNHAPVTISAQALDTRPQSRVEGDLAMDDAVAAAVIGAVSKQFGEQRVAVKLDTVDVAPASILDRTVSGAGRLQIGGEVEWIPFEFSALYDTVATSVSYPQLKIGGAAPAHAVAANSKLARALSDKVGIALRNEFPQQPVAFRMQQVTSSAAGQRLVLLRGVGTADFGPEGGAMAQVEALYDSGSGKWLRMDYELGEAADRAARPIAAR